MYDYSNQPLIEERDYGGEVPYAFGYLPENKRMNDEIMARALERRKVRLASETKMTAPPNRG